MCDFSSENISNLATALLKVHAQIGPLSKDSVNPFLHNRYASLPAVLDVVRRPLLDNGILLVQRVIPSESGMVSVETRLIHAESGEWLSSTTSIPLADVEAGSKVNLGQQTGCAVSYARRYGLMAMLSLAAVDEDTDNEVRQPQPQPQYRRFQPPQHTEPSESSPASVSTPAGVARASYPGLPDISGVSYQEDHDADGRQIVVAKGATLQNKGSLRQAGFRWNPDRKTWWIAA